MSLRTHAVSIVRLFAAAVLAAAGLHVNAQTSEAPSMTSTGVIGFNHVGDSFAVTASLSTVSNIFTGGDVTFAIYDSASVLIATPCSASPILPLFTFTTSSNCGPFTVPFTAGNYELRMIYSGAGGVNPKTIVEPFTVARYFSDIVYTGIDNVFSPAEPVGVTKNIVATVQSSGPTPTGTVTFDVRTSPSGTPTNVCTVALDGAGQAACNVTFTAAGYYEVLIAYGGDTFNDPGGPVNPFIQIGHTVVTAADGTGIGSLRDAINGVNGNCSSSTEIVFAIPGTGPHVITPSTPLPALTCSTIVNGYSQPTRVALSGALCGASCNGLELAAGGLVEGLAIHSFQGAGITAPVGLTVLGNYIGTDATVATGLGNGIGIRVIGGTASIGGSAATDRNLVLGNGTGIDIGLGAQANIEGNTIGSPSHGNGEGIAFHGGRASLSGNSISANGGAGVTVYSDATGGLAALDNAIYDNAGLAINLQPGANRDQAAPVLASASSSGGLVTVTGSIQSAPPNANTSVTIELYSSSVARATGTGGESLVHTFNVTLDPLTGFGTFTQTFTSAAPHVAAVATVESCAPPSIAAPGDGLKSARRGKARVIGSGCPVTSEYSPTVAVAPVGQLTITPAALTFAAQDVGTVSAVQTITVSNASSSTIGIQSVTAGGDFLLQSNCPASLVKGASCTLDVKFAPSVAGARNGTLTLVADITYSVALGGTGTVPLAPAISVSPSSLSFGSRTLGTISPAQAVTVTNTGTAPLTISGIATSGDFGSVSACPAVLAAGASCSVAVKFTPLVVGPRAGSLSFASNAGAASVALSGVGVDVPVGTLDVSPLAIDFLTQPLQVPSGVRVVNVTNVGTAIVRILDLALVGDFAIVDAPAGSTSCGGPLAPGAACVFAVVFTPVAAGAREGSMTIVSDGSNPTVTVLLGGFGEQGAPQRALRLPATLAFAAQPFGTRSDAQAVAVVNGSAAAVVVSDVTITGDFAVVEDCGTIPAGGSCTLRVTFLPTARGERSGTLAVRIASESQPYLVALGGLGVANPVPILSVAPTFVAYGNTFTGSVSDAASIVLTNVGEAGLNIDSITAPGDFIMDSHCGATLAAGASCSLDVRFFPRMLDARGGSVEIRSNAAGSPHFVALSGTGCSIPNVGRSRIPQLLCGP